MTLKADWWKTESVMWLGKEYRNILELPCIGIIPFCVFKQLLYPISTQSFVDLLNEPSTSNLHIITDCEERFREHERIKSTPYYSKYQISDNLTLIEDYIPLDDGCPYSYFIEFEDFLVWSNRNLDFIYKLKSINGTSSKLIEPVPDNEQLKARITELETELAAVREQLEEARREISGKEEGHETAHGEDFPAEYEGHGLCSLVIRMRKEGKTEKEIAEFLNGDKGKWCSASQIGALLHRGGNVSADAMLKHAQRLLGKA